MPPRRVSNSKTNTSRSAPAKTPEERENQMINLAMDNAERMMREGTAPSQVVVHYLKLGSTREKLEQHRISQENELLKIKAETIAAASRVEELMQEAIQAFTSYSPTPDNPEDYQ